MDEIYRKLEDIVTLAEMQDEFFEVETMVCIRRRGGAESDFIRMQLDLTDGVQCRVTTKKTRPVSETILGLAPAPNWF